jgi:hypothetical protein
MSNPSEIERFLQEATLELTCYCLHKPINEKEAKIINRYQDALELIEDLSARVHG